LFLPSRDVGGVMKRVTNVIPGVIVDPFRRPGQQCEKAAFARLASGLATW